MTQTEKTLPKDGTHAVVLDLTCPACRGKGEFSSWDCIDGTRNPFLRRRVLLDDRLFFYHCPHCGEAIHVESPCLYIDRQKKFMVWHIPDLTMTVTSAQVCAFLGEDSFDEYCCRAALTWGEWREKIIELESGYDDRLYEMIKYGAYGLVKKEDREKLPLESYHIDYDGGSGPKAALALVFMEKDSRGMGYTYTITETVKNVTADIFLPLLQRMPEMNKRGRFDRFGYSWAQHFAAYVIKSASSGAGGQAFGRLLAFWVQTLGKELFHAAADGPGQGK